MRSQKRPVFGPVASEKQILTEDQMVEIWRCLSCIARENMENGGGYAFSLFPEYGKWWVDLHHSFPL
jgi:hypothetical protein